jgi:NAD(P)-dependent dehydrogenase (short-subunit alcohol dehydrogenase family)
VACDFCDTAAIDRLAELAWAAFGGLDVVLFSSQPPEPNLGTLLTTSEADFLEQHQAIVWGPLRLMRTLAPRMMAGGGGSVITTVSSTGVDPVVGYSAYGLAKGSLALLTRYMAQEWGRGGIRVNAFSPGTVATGSDPAQYEAMLRERGMLDRTALGRVGRNADCTGLAIYFASDESAFTSGQRVFIDGGRF